MIHKPYSPNINIDNRVSFLPFETHKSPESIHKPRYKKRKTTRKPIWNQMKRGPHISAYTPSKNRRITKIKKGGDRSIHCALINR